MPAKATKLAKLAMSTAKLTQKAQKAGPNPKKESKRRVCKARAVRYCKAGGCWNKATRFHEQIGFRCRECLANAC